MKFKKFSAVILSVMILFSTIPFATFTVSAAKSGKTGDCTWSLDGTTLTISGNGYMADYESPNSDRFYGDLAPWRNEYVKTVIIEEGVKSIGTYAFMSCDITVGHYFGCMDYNCGCGCDGFGCCCSNGCTDSCSEDCYCRYGSCYFADYYTSNLEISEVFVASSVERIGFGAFYGCDKIQRMTLPFIGSTGIEYNTTSYGYHTHLGSLFGAVEYYENDSYIPSSLKTVTVLDGCTEIGDYAFYYAENITSISLPDTVTHIGDNAFTFNSLTNFRISENLISLKSFLPAGTWDQNYPDDIIYAGKILYSVKEGKCPLNVTVKDGAVSIWQGAFYGEELKSINIPNSVICVSYGAFMNCTSLEKVYYCGNELEWNSIKKEGGNSPLLEAEINYHNYSDWTITKLPAHEQDGEESRTCSICGKTETKIITALEHNYISVITPPTCNVNGYTTHICSNCGDSYIDCEVLALGHNFSEWNIRINATCTKAGEKYRICSNCDKKEAEIIPALGHDYAEEFIIDKEATDFEEGSKSKHCSRCDSETDVTAVPKISLADGVCGENAKWAVREDGTLVIGGIGATQDFGSYGETPWYDYTDTITNISIGENITYIGFYSFGEIMGLQSVKCDNPNIAFGKWYVFGVDEIVFYGKGGGLLEEYVNANNYTLIKPESPEVPVAPQLLAYNSTTVSLMPILGYEYSMDGINWQTSNIFENLQPFTQYSFYQRIADNVYKASKASEVFSVLTAHLPSSPPIDTIVGTTVTIHPMQTYEYSIDGITWKSTDTFDNLEYNKIYFIYSRYIPTEIMPNPTVSEPTKFIILSAPKVQLVGETKVVIKPVEGCLYSINGKVWQSSNIFTKLIPGYSYTVWQKYADETVYSIQSEGASFITNGKDVNLNPSSDDLVMIMQELLQSKNSNKLCFDYNGDSIINLLDLARLKNYLAGIDLPLGKIENTEIQTINPKTELKLNTTYYHIRNEVDCSYLTEFQFDGSQLVRNALYGTNKEFAEIDIPIIYKGTEYYPYGFGGPLPEYTLTDEEIILEYGEDFLGYPEYNEKYRIVVTPTYDLLVTYSSGWLFDKGDILELTDVN